MSVPKPLEIYTARKPDPKTGGKAMFWIGLKPPQPPEAWLVETAIAFMPASVRESIERIDRVNDPRIPNEKMEDYHVTFVAMIDKKYQTEEEFGKIKKWIEDQEFTEKDLMPELGEKGVHDIDIVNPGRGVVIINFKYHESERLKAARQALAARVCSEAKWTPKSAHVAAAYCVEYPPEPYLMWLPVVVLLAILFKVFSADDDDQSAFLATYIGLATAIALTLFSRSTAGVAAALLIIADHNTRLSWSLLHWPLLWDKSVASLGRVHFIQWVALVLFIVLNLTGVKARTRDIIKNRAFAAAFGLKMFVMMYTPYSTQQWAWWFGNSLAMAVEASGERRRLSSWMQLVFCLVFPIVIIDKTAPFVEGVAVAGQYFIAMALAAHVFMRDK